MIQPIPLRADLRKEGIDPFVDQDTTALDLKLSFHPRPPKERRIDRRETGNQRDRFAGAHFPQCRQPVFSAYQPKRPNSTANLDIPGMSAAKRRQW
jgi:hypothetical protein